MLPHQATGMSNRLVHSKSKWLLVFNDVCKFSIAHDSPRGDWDSVSLEAERNALSTTDAHGHDAALEAIALHRMKQARGAVISAPMRPERRA